MKFEEIHEGAEVYWNDPDAGICSGYYTVYRFLNDDVVVLTNKQGSLVEAFIHELS